MNIKYNILFFAARCILNAFGIWIAIRILGTGYSDEQIIRGVPIFIFAGCIFSVVNATLKPVVIAVSLPAILITLGFFTVIVNGFMVYISLKLAPGIHMTFINSIFAGLILSLVNYIVSSTIELQRLRIKEV